MSLPDTLPRNLNAWIQYLDGIRLPIAESSHAQVCSTLADSRRSMREIADVMQQSPPLALLVLREANRDSAQPATSLELALTRLGVSRTEALLRRTPRAAEHEIPLALRQLTLISQHAAQQASGLFGHRLARLWQDIHWCSLLFLAPLWPLACAYPELILTWQQRVMIDGEPAERVGRELLGVPVRELCAALAEHWRLPEWIGQGYRLLGSDRRLLVKALHIARDELHPLHQQQLLDQDPPLRRWLTQPGNTILLANGLATAAHACWSDLHNLRWQRLTGLYLQQPLAAVQQLVHQQAVRSAQLHSRPGIWHPAQALLWPTGTPHLRRPAPRAEVSTDLQRWRECCAELLRSPSVFANVLQLTACARDALVACGLQRLTLMLADRSHTRLLSQQSHGLGERATGFSLQAQQSQILRKLLEAPAQLHLDAQNIARYSAFLPGPLKALFESENLLLQSIGNQGRVIMLLVADMGGSPFAEAQRQACSKTVQCLERALQQFARRPR